MFVQAFLPFHFSFLYVGKQPATVNLEDGEEEENLGSKKRNISNGVQINEPSDQLAIKLEQMQSAEAFLASTVRKKRSKVTLIQERLNYSKFLSQTFLLTLTISFVL